MRRFQIAPGVHLSYDAAQKFNRCRISIHFAFPARRETATAHALLPLVMERGYADCPDMTQMTKKLARLYGADLTVDARPMGCSHNLCVSITGIKDQFALEGEKLTQEYAALALGTAFHPYFVGSTFDPEAVGIEKQMLKKALEDEVNDKRLYCQRQANREFFGDSPAGVRQEGYLEEVDGLTPEALTEAYYEMLRTANIELIVLGCDEASTTTVKDALLTELSAIDRAPLPRAENIAMPRREPVRKVEHFDTTQAKLCMLFTLGRPMQPEQLAAVRLAMALYGGSVTSRLFLNVRERDHLCYYCSSSFQSFTGSMAVNSGVEHTDAARAEQAVLKELADLCDGPITDEELEDCRRGLLAGMNGLEDTLGGIETWYYMEVLRGGPVQTPDDARHGLMDERPAEKVERLLRPEPMTLAAAEKTITMPIAKSCFGLGFKEEPLPFGDLRSEMLYELILCCICGGMSPLYRRLYDEGLTNPGFGGEVLRVDGCCCILFTGESDQPDTVRQLLLDEIERVRKEGVDREIFTLCKNEKYGQLIENLENVEDSASQMADFALAGQTVAQQITMLAGLTAEDADAALQHILRPERMAVMYIEPDGTAVEEDEEEETEE